MVVHRLQPTFKVADLWVHTLSKKKRADKSALFFYSINMINQFGLYYLFKVMDMALYRLPRFRDLFCACGGKLCDVDNRETRITIVWYYESLVAPN